MKYRQDKYGNSVSALGYGCMRFSKKGLKTDLKKTENEIMTAINLGVNYFDTAYIYPGSESTLGTILKKNSLRDKVYIATKLPQYMIKTVDKAQKFFDEELARLQTDYVDYYLMHMLNDIKSWERLKMLGIEEWINQKKSEGRIKQIGFSYHGNSDMFCELIDAYDWDFCQIQYNYMDENSQAGRRGLEYAYKKGIPVVIMEPLRGGRLANNLPREAQKLIERYDKKYSPAQWAFRWLWDQKEPMCVLSGMNSLEMIKENCKTIDEMEVGDLTQRDNELIQSVLSCIKGNVKVSCTGCGYCMPCPAKVDIPGIFTAYNNVKIEGRFQALKQYIMCTVLRKDVTSASGCVGCGKCEEHCPQDIEIRKELKNAQNALEGFTYKIGKKILSKMMKY